MMSSMANLVRSILMVAVAVSAADAIEIGLVILQDVHPLWGGQNFYLNHDGRACNQIVERGNTEKRYCVRLDAGDVRQMETLLAEVDFMNIEIVPRAGVPDEAKPAITVTFKSGKSWTVEKWSNDKHPGFDRIYEWILARVNKSTTSKPEYEGPYQPQWRPDWVRSR